MIDHCMLDMETLAVGHSPAILSLGAVMFDPHGTDTLESLRSMQPLDAEGPLPVGFYVKIKLDEQVPFRAIDINTIRWWMGQSDTARKEAFQDPNVIPFREAITAFAIWLQKMGMKEIWSFGAKADLLWIETAFAAAGVQTPIHYRSENCLRTFVKWAMEPKPVLEGMTSHNAFDDACLQAIWVQRAFKNLAKPLVHDERIAA